MPPLRKPNKKLACKSCGRENTVKFFVVGRRSGKKTTYCTHCCEEDYFNKCSCGHLYDPPSWEMILTDGGIHLRYPQLHNMCYNCGHEHVSNTEPRDIKECDGCGRLFGEDGEEIGEYKLCQRCAGNFVPCIACDKRLATKRNTQGYINTTTGKVEKLVNHCTECLLEKLTSCAVCHTQINKGHTDMCPDCAIHALSCDLCEKLVHREDVRIIDKKKLCKDCYRKRVGYCSICGEYALDVGYQYHHNIDRGKEGCRKCIGLPVMHWRFKPAPEFHGQGLLYYGIENEYEFTKTTYKTKTNKLRKIYERDTLRYLVHDGSLNYGVEMVFHPMTFDYIAELQELLPPEVKNTVGDTAGCHVHMTKSAFGTLHLFKFINFMTQNMLFLYPIFKRAVGEISPKTGRAYCKELPYKNTTLAKARMGDNKYWWINLSNEKTIEIRLFKAAKNTEELKANVQFLDSLYYFTKDTAILDLSFEAYLKFVDQKQYEYVCKVFGVGEFHKNNLKRKGG